MNTRFEQHLLVLSEPARQWLSSMAIGSTQGNKAYGRLTLRLQLLGAMLAIAVLLALVGVPDASAEILRPAAGAPTWECENDPDCLAMRVHDAVPAAVDAAIEVLDSDNNYFLKIDLQDSRVQIRVGLANNDGGGYQTLGGQVGRYSGQGYASWAAINADYFGNGCPSNVNCAQGLTYISGARKENWSEYGSTWQVRGNVGFDGSRSIEGAVGDAQGKRNMVIAGGPWILRGGGTPQCNPVASGDKTYFPDTGEWFDGDVRAWCTRTDALTAVGYSADRRFLFMGISRGGKTITQLAQWLKDRGASDVIKLDSGLSTGMYHNGTSIHFSSRAIANHLAVVVSSGGTPPPPPPSGWAYQIFPLGDFNGERFESTQTYDDLSAVGKNDWAESLKVNSGYGILACTDSGFRGICGRVTGPAQFSDINALAQGLRRGLSSIKVCSGQCDPPSPPPSGWAYQIFSLGDFNGDRYESNQTIANLASVGRNDWAQSMKVNSGYEIIACSDADFRGSCGSATGPAQFSDINALAQGLRNGLSSIRVCGGACPRPPSQPALRSPTNNTTIPRGATVILDWDPAANAVEYTAEYSGPTGLHNSGRRRESDWNIGQLPEGTYRWRVEAYNNEGWSGWTAEWSFTVSPPAPSAQFDAWPLSGRAPFETRFHIVSTSNMTNCQWDYGDGTTGNSCAAYHDHTFTNPGSYTIRLTASGVGGSDSQTRTNYITVEGQPPTAQFDASPLAGQAPLTVHMHNLSQGNITACLWEYGDGTTGSSCSAYHDHTYVNPGNYTVRLTVTGPHGSNTHTRNGYVAVAAPPNASDCADGEGVVLYENLNFAGRCTRFTTDDENLADDVIGDNTASSIRVLGSFEATLFENSGYSGASTTFTADDSDLRNNQIGSDRASAVRVRRIDPGGTSNCDGGPGAYLYEHPDYQGRCSKYTGDSPESGSWFVGNDTASSIRFVGNYQATVFEHTWYGGVSSTFTGDDPNFGNDAINHDRASSIQVRPRSAPGGSNCDGGTGVYLYEHQNYQGRCSKFMADSPRPSDWYVGNDAASAIRIVGDLEATVYDHDNYQGTNSLFTSDDPDFGNDAIGDDRASSIRVRTRSGGPTSCPDGKFLAEYFANRQMAGSPVFRRCEDRISADWGYGGPDNGIGSDNFAVRWTGRQWFSDAGVYRFVTRTDDGVRLWVDDQLLVNQWHDMGTTEFRVERHLNAGLHTLKLEFYENGGYATAQLTWERQSGGPPDQDDGRTFSFGQSLDGTINPAGDRDDYYFDGSAGHAITIRMDRRDGNLDSYIELYSPDGTLLGQDDDNGGNLNARVSITLRQNGRHKIIARGYNTSTGGYRLRLDRESTSDPDDNRWIAFGTPLQGTISPVDDRDTYYFSGTAGRMVNIRMNKLNSALDSYLELYNPAGVKVAENDDGGGDRNAWIAYTLPASGTYRILARSYGLASVGQYNLSVTSISSTNLARGKPTAASSAEYSGAEGWRATDGNTSTRWSSRFSDPQWIYVDLGQDRTFNQVVLKWEAAYGKRFGIYYQSSSMCSSCWTNVYWTNSGRGGTNTITFSPVRARYVLMYGAERGTSWGYSLWEFEVYDNTALVLPLVPSDPGDKPPESVAQVVPLAPNDEGKETLLVGEGDAGQEEMPLIGGNPEPASVGVTDNPPTAMILYPSEIAPSEEDILFQGVATDSDENGESIVEYRWISSVDGPIGAVDVFTLAANALSPGQHVITFQARDNEGNWSEPVTTTLSISSHLYLPQIIRQR